MKEELIKFLQLRYDLALHDAEMNEEYAKEWETYDNDEFKRKRAISCRMSRDWSLKDAAKFKEWIEWLNESDRPSA